MAEVLDLVIGPGLLGAELVTRKPEDLEVLRVLGLDVLVELLKAGVLGRETAFGGGVDDEHDLALEVGHRLLDTLLCFVLFAG